MFFYEVKNDVIFACQSYAAFANNAIFNQKLMSDFQYFAINMFRVWLPTQIKISRRLKIFHLKKQLVFLSVTAVHRITF